MQYDGCLVQQPRVHRATVRHERTSTLFKIEPEGISGSSRKWAGTRPFKTVPSSNMQAYSLEINIWLWDAIDRLICTNIPRLPHRDQHPVLWDEILFYVILKWLLGNDSCSNGRSSPDCTDVIVGLRWRCRCRSIPSRPQEEQKCARGRRRLGIVAASSGATWKLLN